MKTKIEWTEQNYNPFYGCRRKSDGCLNCYAEEMAGRFSGIDKNGKVLPYNGIAQKIGGKSRWTGKIKLNEEVLLAPLRNKKPTKYFVNSMSDTFYSEFPDEWIDRVFAVMALCPQHTFQILTKRPERMRDYANSPETKFRLAFYIDEILAETISCVVERANKQIELQDNNVISQTNIGNDYLKLFPLPNVWLGASVENQKHKDRINLVRQTPAAVHFLSLEPLLENLGELDLTGIDWVIVGGESGTGSRGCSVDWIRSIVGQCETANVPCFVKQLGAKPFIRDTSWRAKDVDYRREYFNLQNKKGGDISEFPKDLQIRQFPGLANG